MSLSDANAIGCNNSKKRYIFHGMSIEGDADSSEGFVFATVPAMNLNGGEDECRHLRDSAGDLEPP